MTQNLTYIRGGHHTSFEKDETGKVTSITVSAAPNASSDSFGAGGHCHLQFIAEDLIRIVKAQPDRKHPLLPHQTDATEGLLLMAADLTRIAKTWPL